jgi:hypothetical protein
MEDSNGCSSRRRTPWNSSFRSGRTSKRNLNRTVCCGYFGVVEGAHRRFPYEASVSHKRYEPREVSGVRRVKQRSRALTAAPMRIHLQSTGIDSDQRQWFDTVTSTTIRTRKAEVMDRKHREYPRYNVRAS